MLRALCSRAELGETRVHPQAFRHSFAAELIGEGWPLPYIQRQLGITTFRNIDTLLNNLGLPQPADDEVMAVVRTRVWDGL
jgi:integrase